MVREEEVPPLRKKPGRNIRLISAAVIVIIVAAAAAFALCRITGEHRRIFSPSDYGRLRISITSPENGAEIAPRTTLFADDGGEIPEIDAAVRYIPRPNEYSSLPLVIPAGRYRAKTVIGNEIIWSSFELDSWKNSHRNRELIIDITEEEAQPVDIKSSVHDSSDGTDIARSAEVEIFLDGKFMPVESVRIYSDQVYHFRISAEGYRAQEYILRINRNERVLRLQAELSPQTDKE